MLKFLISILFLTVFLAGSSSASDLTDGKGKPKTEKPKKKIEKNEGDSETAPEKEKPSKLALYSPDTSVLEEESDSTYNSVNKYNFIFYFIYKYKYDAGAESLRGFLN